MIVSAVKGWRGLYSLDTDRLETREIAFWSQVDDYVYGVVTDDRGQLTPAPEILGFMGYLDPDDNPIGVASKIMASREKYDG